MSTTDYRIRLRFDTLRVRANLAEASAPILLLTEDGTTPTGYQTADARHRKRDMARLAVRSCGTDYWLDPSDAAPEDEDACIDGLIVSVTSA